MTGRARRIAAVAVAVAATGAVVSADAAARSTSEGPAAAVVTSPTEADSLPAFIMSPIPVRADRLPDPLGPFPLTTYVVDSAALARRPGGDLRSALLPLAGVRITSRGTPGTGSSVSIRGSTSDRVLVLVDGRRANTAQGGGVDLSALPLDVVERVEVFRGGASALWGSGAIGGAVAVHTRRPTPGFLSTRAELGSFGARRIAARAGAGLGGEWRGRLAGRRFQTDGNYAYDDDRRDIAGEIVNGDVSRTSAEIRAEGPLARRWLARIDVGGEDAKRGIPGSEEFPTPTARLHDERLSAGLRLEPRTPTRWQPTVDLTVSRADRAYSDRGAPFGPIADAHRNERATTDLSLARVDSLHTF